LRGVVRTAYSRLAILTDYIDPDRYGPLSLGRKAIALRRLPVHRYPVIFRNICTEWSVFRNRPQTLLRYWLPGDERARRRSEVGALREIGRLSGESGNAQKG